LKRNLQIFEEAWNHDDARSQEKWREAIIKEFEEMEKKQVWVIGLVILKQESV
jgi:hypothetical protein